MSSPSPQQHPPADGPPSAAPQSSLPTQASTFQPFFTLISPTAANPSHSHPHVHYVFADDPTDPTLDLPPSNRERIITVDIDSSLHVTSAHSLSKDFQLVNATVSSAPQMLAASEGEAAVAGGGGLMLTIEGVEGGLRGVKASGGVYELAEAFSDRMAMLRRVVEFAGAVGPQDGQDPVDMLHPRPERQAEEDTADETVTEESEGSLSRSGREQLQ